MPQRLSTFSAEGAGPVSMMVGSVPIDAKPFDSCTWLQSQRVAGFLVSNEHSRCAIDDATGIAARMNMVDHLDFGIFLQCDRVEASLLPGDLECGF